MKKIWVIKTPDERTVRHLCRRVGCHPVTAAVLVNRGFISEADISAFLSPSLQGIVTYAALKDTEKAVHRIARAITSREKIMVFGDYDVDGVTSATITCQFLKQAGADATCYIPHRMTEGYGLRLSHVREVIVPAGIELVITTDCGSSSHDAVKAAKQAGIDIIITDHHDIPDLPPADAVINPKRSDCTAGLEHLAGVGVAFFLLVCLRKHLREIGHWQQYAEPNLKEICDMVALGTIADVVPLVRENRVIARAGLEVINNSPRPGIKALVDVCGITRLQLETGDLAFRLAPRLNAAGRMEHAMLAADLLTTDDPETAGKLAEIVNGLNIERQNTEAGIFQRIDKFIEQDSALLQSRSLILFHEEWHQGVLGIVASRLVEKYFRPVILFSMTDGLGIGSARSIPGIDLYSTLTECAPFLERFGGHAMAAGLRIRREKINSFRETFDASVRRSCPPDVFQPLLTIDGELGFDMISDTLGDELQMLQPYGQQNPEPLFMATHVRVMFSKILGNRHRRMLLKQPESKTQKTLPAICFNVDPAKAQQLYFEKIAYRLRWNHFNDRRSLQLVVEEME